ncbi:MAG: TRAP transporter small permease [Burkholderiaceae bacterium]
MAAAGFTVAILVIIVLQMAARWSGIAFPGSTDYAGYRMASASFLAFAHALNRGAHIRVGLLLNVLGPRRRLGEAWCFGIGSALGVYFAYYAVKAVYWSYRLNDISQGQDATPLWVPQLGMAVGAVVFAIALLDHLVRVIRTGDPGIVSETADQAHAE